MSFDKLRLSRRHFLQFSALGTATVFGNCSLRAVPNIDPETDEGVAWYDVLDWGVEGKGWTDTVRFFDRLPRRAENFVRKSVWNLSRHAAGMSASFETDATDIHVRYKLLSPNLAMSHMPATGVSGLDLYASDTEGRLRWLAVARPTAQEMRLRLAADIDPPAGGERRKYRLYLPLYNGVDALKIGVAPGADFLPVAPRSKRPLVFYGTSIMHGACASRPGMCITGILGRRLDCPTINLGFSGNGTMDAEVGALLAELDASVYVIDCLPNMQAAAVAERTGPLVRQLRAARPDTPILLVEDRTYTYAPFRKSSRERHAASRAALRRAYDHLVSAGVANLEYLEGDSLLGDDGEATTDGSHPSDLGMVRYADAYEPKLRRLMKQGTNQLSTVSGLPGA